MYSVLILNTASHIIGVKINYKWDWDNRVASWIKKKIDPYLIPYIKLKLYQRFNGINIKLIEEIMVTIFK